VLSPLPASPLDSDSTFTEAPSVLGNLWRLPQQDERLIAALMRQHDLPDLVARVLAARGVALEQAAGFLAPTLKNFLPDPSSLKDMDAAALRIARAIEAGEQIAIFADYDVDGATSAALWLRFLRSVGNDPYLYIPDRIEEGYGPNAPALLALGARGAKLIVTVDCGVMAHEPLAAAKEAGIDVVVIDHHIAAAALPPASAIVNPNRLDDTSGLGHLCAAGVSYLAIVAVNRALKQRGWYQRRAAPDLLQWLDLVALGTVCDVVPLSGLNRAFVAQGLKVMAARGNIGLAALADVARVHERPTCYHLGFVFGPRINAGGRIGKADLGARLLSTESVGEAQAIAIELDALNLERRRLEAEILETALALAEADDPAHPVLVVAGEGWHPGVVGIVASRLAERMKKPVCVVAVNDGIGKASGRSRPGFDLGHHIIAAREAGILDKGGGHAMAAGFTVQADRIDALKDYFRESAGTHTPGSANLSLDGMIAVTGATLDLALALDRLGPYGQGHREPLLALLDCHIVKADVVGETHVRCILGSAGGGSLKAIAFRALDMSSPSRLGETLLKGGRRLHLAGRLGIDRWQGRELPKFEIVDAISII
jgi:single-stranded-DNA-specific exonuclease